MSAEEVFQAVRAGGLLDAGDKLVVMLSGGRDSVCLLDLAVRVRRPREVLALHVNYGLRAAADAEERDCQRLCAALSVPLTVARVQRVAGAAGNLQAWAREVRYEAAFGLAERQEPAEALIATGHTASDQVETILYRLAASPGRRALLGMAPRDGRLIRPLLGITREQTGAYCSARGLRWSEDESNADEAFARARVRHRLVQALREVHPGAESNVLRTAELLRQEGAVLDALVEHELHGGSSIALERLQALPAALARLVVIRLAEQAAGTFVPQAGGRVEEILELARRGGRAELHIGGSVGAVVSGGALTMVALPPRG